MNLLVKSKIMLTKWFYSYFHIQKYTEYNLSTKLYVTQLKPMSSLNVLSILK